MVCNIGRPSVSGTIRINRPASTPHTPNIIEGIGPQMSAYKKYILTGETSYSGTDSRCATF